MERVHSYKTRYRADHLKSMAYNARDLDSFLLSVAMQFEQLEEIKDWKIKRRENEIMSLNAQMENERDFRSN